MAGETHENAYFRSRRTKSCILDAKISNGNALAICECQHCRQEALQRSCAIDVELARHVRETEKEIFLYLLGLTSATNEVTKILLKLDNPSFGSVTASTTKLVVEYAKSSVRSCAEALVREELELNDTDKGLLERATTVEEIDIKVLQDKLCRITELWRKHHVQQQAHWTDDRLL
jgi:hypothetical protein